MGQDDARESRPRMLLFGLVAVLVFLALLNRFIQDDAFISFQYARNLVEGNGLTFNPGERVEGYTNFLWTLLISAGVAIGAEPILWSYVLGLCFFGQPGDHLSPRGRALGEHRRRPRGYPAAGH